jgi:hypothetical protein
LRRKGKSAIFVQHSTAQHSTAQHSTAQHSTAQHSIDSIFFNTQYLAIPETGFSHPFSGVAFLFYSPTY